MVKIKKIKNKKNLKIKIKKIGKKRTSKILHPNLFYGN
jgi:hypothetical protein